MNILGYKLIQRRTERKMNFKARTLLTFSVKIFSAPRLNLSFKVALSCVDESYLNRHIHHDNFSATPHSNRQKSGVSTLVISFKEHTAPVWLPMVTYIQFRTETGCELKTVGWDTDCPVQSKSMVLVIRGTQFNHTELKNKCIQSGKIFDRIFCSPFH